MCSFSTFVCRQQLRKIAQKTRNRLNRDISFFCCIFLLSIKSSWLFRLSYSKLWVETCRQSYKRLSALPVGLVQHRNDSYRISSITYRFEANKSLLCQAHYISFLKKSMLANTSNNWTDAIFLGKFAKPWVSFSFTFSWISEYTQLLISGLFPTSLDILNLTYSLIRI